MCVEELDSAAGFLFSTTFRDFHKALTRPRQVVPKAHGIMYVVVNPGGSATLKPPEHASQQPKAQWLVLLDFPRPKIVNFVLYFFAFVG